MELHAITVFLVGMVVLIEANSPDQCRCEEKINACVIRDGTPGANGLPGRDGLPGPVGEKGEQGFQGIQGAPGKAGPPGQKGDNGSTGQKGLPGNCDDEEVKVLKTQAQDLQAQLEALKQEVAKSMKALQLPGGIRVGEKIFRTNGLRGTYESAAARCVIDGGVLASPRNAAENHALLEIVKAHNMHAVLGINDIQTESTFTYSNGEIVGFTNWAKNEPNNDEGEDCTELMKNGFWNDFPCIHERLIVCEY